MSAAMVASARVNEAGAFPRQQVPMLTLAMLRRLKRR